MCGLWVQHVFTTELQAGRSTPGRDATPARSGLDIQGQIVRCISSHYFPIDLLLETFSCYGFDYKCTLCIAFYLYSIDLIS